MNYYSLIECSIQSNHIMFSTAQKSDKELNAVNNTHIYNIMQTMKSYRPLSVDIDGLVICFERNNLFCIPNTIYQHGKTAFEQQCFSREEMSFAEWHDKLFIQKETWWPAACTFYNGNMMEDVLQYNSFVNSANKGGYAISFLMEVKDFRTQLIFPSVSSAYLNILDASGNILYSDGLRTCNPEHIENGEQIKYENMKYRIWKARLNTCRLEFLCIIPQTVFLQSIRPIALTLQILMALACLVILGAVIIMLRCVVFPLSPLINLVSRESSLGGRKKNIFSLIYEAYERQKEISQSSTQAYDSIRAQMTKAALRHSLRGDSLNAYEQHMLSLLPVLSGSYVVVIFRLFPIDQQAIQNIQDCGSALFGRIWNTGAVYDQGEIIVVLPENVVGSKKESLNECFNQFCGQTVFMAWSKPHTGIEQLRDAENEARAFLNNQKRWIRINKKSTRSICFETLQRLERELENGNTDAVFETLSQIENLLRCNATPEYNEIVLLSLRYILLNSAGIVLPMEDSKRAFSVLSLEGIRKNIQDYCAQINKNSEQESIVEQIVEYIEVNISDSEMCLSKLETHFNLSPSYISMLIKQYTGVSYANYVTELRMRQAMNLLVHTDRSIDDISLSVGYYHKNTFYKVFKKTYGKPPMNFRNK